MPNAPDDPLSSQNIKDRYYGVNDPVADKMMRRAATMPKLETPSDKTISTLYVGGLDDRITEKDLRFDLFTFSTFPIHSWSFILFSTVNEIYNNSFLHKIEFTE